MYIDLYIYLWIIYLNIIMFIFFSLLETTYLFILIILYILLIKNNNNLIYVNRMCALCGIRMTYINGKCS